MAPEERVFSLILALLTSPIGYTKQQLLTTVYGYAEDVRKGANLDSVERRFERDKDQIRELGIPLEVVDSPQEPGNTQLARYRIQKTLFQVPDDVRFTQEEARLLKAAALAWQDGSLSQESRRAMMKLSALAEDFDDTFLGITPFLSISEPSVHAIREALSGGKQLSFLYRKAEQQRASRRRVSPLRLHRADGRWHLIAFDHGRDDYRVFLLMRIIGEVDVLAADINPTLQNHVSAIIDDLNALQEQQIAHIRVVPGSHAHAVLRPRAVESSADEASLRINTLDYAALAEELLSFGEDVEVLGPPLLRRHIHRILTTIQTQHAPLHPEDGRLE